MKGKYLRLKKMDQVELVAKDFIRHMVSQAHYVAGQCPSNWIYMWIKKFKNDPEVLLAFNFHDTIWLLKEQRKEKLNKLNSWDV